MKRYYTLFQLYHNLNIFKTAISENLFGQQHSMFDYSDVLMGLTSEQTSALVSFICATIYCYYDDDVVAYPTLNEDPQQGEQDVTYALMKRLCYDIALKLPYWYKKYNTIKNLLTSDELSLLQTSKVSSSSTDETDSASGSLQKGATTPTGVTAETTPDKITIKVTPSETTGDETSINTNGFVDKYTNHQQKFVNANKVKGSRSGTILREGSIDELLNILEKLPSSFANEVCKEVQKHFIFDYDGLQKGIYKLAYD